MRATVFWVSLSVLWVLAASAGVALAGATEELVSAVPEPTSLALLAVGLGGIAVAKFRHRK